MYSRLPIPFLSKFDNQDVIKNKWSYHYSVPQRTLKILPYNCALKSTNIAKRVTGVNQNLFIHGFHV